jgi:hypothetical protein
MASAEVDLKTGTRVIEIGCGNGSFLFPFSEALSAMGIRPVFTGIDIAANAISEACQSTGSNPPIFSCITLDAHRSEHDIALLIDVVEHVPSPVEFLASAQRIAPVMLIHLPIEHSVLHLMSGRPTASYRAYRHIHFFSRETARLLIEDAGWQIVHEQHSAADTATLNLPAPWWLRIGRYVRFLAYMMAPQWTSLVSGGSVTFVCKRPARPD